MALRMSYSIQSLFPVKSGTSALGVPLTAGGWLVNTDERQGPGLSVRYLGITWFRKTSPLPKPTPHLGPAYTRGQSKEIGGRDHGHTPARTRYHRWETLQNVDKGFQHHNHCSGSRTAVRDLWDPFWTWIGNNARENAIHSLFHLLYNPTVDGL